MQHEVNFDIRNYEGTIALERDGYANHPNFDSNVYRWGTVQSRVGGEVNFRLGNPVGADNHDFKTLSNNGWVNVYNFEPLSLTGGSNQSFIPPLPYFYFACHPHVSGHVTISFN